MTKLQFRVLYREFLFRMVDLEVLSAHALGDSSKLLGQFAALLLFISLLLSGTAFGFAAARMPPAAALVFTIVTEQFLISTTMLVVGLFAVLSWDSTFPSRHDVLVLAPLPVRARTMFLAKVAAVATALTLTVAFLHGASGLIWPIAFAMHATAQTAPALTYDPTPVPVSAAGLQPVMNHDLSKLLATGALSPGTGAGLTIGVYKKGERRIFTYGAARPDSLFEIASLTKTFTALILARMVEDGKTKLDEPVRELLPPRRSHYWTWRRTTRACRLWTRTFGRRTGPIQQRITAPPNSTPSCRATEWPNRASRTSSTATSASACWDTRWRYAPE